MPTPPLIYVDVYRCAPGRRGSRGQRWRWRAINAGNGRKLAAAGEAFTNEQDCIDSVTQLFGTGSNVYLRQAEHGDQVLRLAAGEQQ